MSQPPGPWGAELVTGTVTAPCAGHLGHGHTQVPKPASRVRLEGLIRAQPSPSQHSPRRFPWSGWVCWKAGVPANPAQFRTRCCKNRFLSWIQRPQVGKLPEGHEEETPTSALKAPGWGWPRREGSAPASWVGFHLKNTASCSKHELTGGTEPKPWAGCW